MPFRSESQRRWMWANHPDMARRWAEHTSQDAGPPRRARKRRKAAAWLLDLVESVAGRIRGRLD